MCVNWTDAAYKQPLSNAAAAENVELCRKLEYKDINYTETCEETLRIEVKLMESSNNKTKTIFKYTLKHSEVHLSGETPICFCNK